MVGQGQMKPKLTEFLGIRKKLVHIKGSKTTENACVRATTIVKNIEEFEASKQD